MINQNQYIPLLGALQYKQEQQAVPPSVSCCQRACYICMLDYMTASSILATRRRTAGPWSMLQSAEQRIAEEVWANVCVCLFFFGLWY